MEKGEGQHFKVGRQMTVLNNQQCTMRSEQRQEGAERMSLSRGKN